MKWGLIPTFALLLSSCTALPKLPEDDPQWVLAYSNVIQCEIHTVFSEMTKDQKKIFAGWGATYSISQNAEGLTSAGLNPLRWVTPARVDKFWLSASADASRKNYRNAKAEFSVPVQLKDSGACEKASKSKVKVDPKDLRLREWVGQIANATETATPNTFSYSVTVNGTSGLGIVPAFANGRAVADGSLSYKRTTNQIVDFAFSGPRRDPKPTEVIIVGDKRGVPRGGDGKGSGSLPESIILQNREAIQGLQLDRVVPDR